MFATISGRPDPMLEDNIRMMAAALRAGESPIALRIWCDPVAGIALAGGSAGVLPEDVFDRQPYVDEKRCFVAEGQVANRVEVGERLGLSTQELACMADSEVLYRAFQRWGTDCSRWLTGDYSFCTVLRRTGQVTAATDHRGGSTVLYAERDGVFLVATQMGAMLAHPAVDAEPDVAAVALLVAPRMLRDRASIKGVLLLPGGSLLEHVRNTTTLRRWWRPEENPQVRYRDGQQYVEHALHAMTTAVRAQLRTASGGISVMMSGGLDSTLVAAIAATELRRKGQKLTVYTSVPEPRLSCTSRPNWDTDELTETQAVVAAHPNMVHVVVRPEGRSPLDYMPRIHRVSHTVLRNSANVVWLEPMSAGSSRIGSRVMLNGGAGNAGISLEQGAVLGTLFEENRPFTALWLARQDASRGGTAMWRILAREARHRMLQRWPREASQRPGLCYLRPEFVRSVSQHTAPRTVTLRSRAQRVKFITNTIPFWVPDSMAQYGIVQHDPTADKGLIETLLSFPIESCMAGGLARGMARQMGAGLVPDAVRLRRRRGAQSPEHASVVRLHAPQYRAALASLYGSPACRETFNLDLTKATLELCCAGKAGPEAAIGVEAVLNTGLFFLEKRY